ncbi:MAG TPA: glycosyltransferase family 2 protein [Anaerolineae bacterium]|nr:glycosyltransferase family 2 protein [Anaerolineae bacterium]
MRLGVNILNWNQADDTLKCVSSVRSWQITEKVVWVVDNASCAADRDRLVAGLDKETLLVSETNRGFAGGNNLAIQAALAAGCQYILLLNNDARISEENVNCLRQALNDDPRLGIVGPTLWDGRNPNRLLSAGGGDIGTAVSPHLTTPPAPDEIREVTYAPGTCALIRREIFERVGLLDETYFFGGEMADLCMRAREAGYTVAIVGGAKAFHTVDRSSEIRHWLHIYYVLRNRFLFVRKFHRRRQWRLFLFWTAQSGRPWLQAVLAGDWRRERAIRLAVWDGWRGRFGGQNRRVSRGEIA